jgi:hypothetical protein
MGRAPGFSSLGYSVAAYQPYYAPPTFPQTNYIATVTPLTSVNIIPAQRLGYNATGIYAGVVNSRNRTAGMTWLYSRGAQVKRWFRMISTGRVESTKFQPITDSTWFSMFNGNLYRCGYPRNLGWSEKVPTIPPAALGTAPWQMLPTPRFRRNVYTRRSFTTAPSVPAQPRNG